MIRHQATVAAPIVTEALDGGGLAIVGAAISSPTPTCSSGAITSATLLSHGSAPAGRHTGD